VVAGHLKSSEGFVEAHKSLKATAMKLIEIWSGQAERARAKIVDVEAALEDPDKPAPPELTAKDMRRVWREGGGTKQSLYRARTLAELSDEEFEARLERRAVKPKAG
jgi:hypothetical protein